MKNKDLQKPCWIPTQQSKSDGYVRVSVKSKLVYLHRLTYETFNGMIPKGLVIDHLCKERSCCNPNHLEAVTSAENTRRGDTGKKIALFHKSKTHCPKGHEYTKDNTYYSKTEYRNCRTCGRIRCREYRRKKQLAIKEKVVK